MSEPEASEQRRLARNLNELLQELRVAQTGVQVLFGFLLSLAFTERYAHADGFLHIVHITTVMLAAVAVCLLIAPVAWHRVLFRRGRREAVVNRGSVLTVLGLTALALAMAGAVLLIGYTIFGGLVGGLLSAAIALLYLLLWFGVPLWARR
ncbi:DUF6328 family protein [Kutzneria albida]|uniref:Uncharacterized protein n=1 Tax=Kutzneria albida DSM 43870 TaxID=1449976 RepID=W5WB05_9PSEU|nr:DUF6328 family protein [Kutzneria albida]AHH97945.1 hypothetical protein KALB_4583 [Kutzneria albida DSM 43870]